MGPPGAPEAVTGVSVEVIKVPYPIRSNERDPTNPIDPGSGGGAWDNEDGGDGGGLILINASSI